MNRQCPIWGSGYPAQVHRSAQNPFVLEVDSPRAGGSFAIETLVEMSTSLNDQAKARLTTWILDRNALGERLPEVTHQIVDYAKGRQSLPVFARARRLLSFIVQQAETVDGFFDTRSEDPRALAWSESTRWSEVAYFVDYLLTNGWLAAPQDVAIRTVERYKMPAIVMASVDGHSQVAANQEKVNTSQAFVAMWFDDSMTEAYEKGIQPAIEDAGYKAMRIDQKEHANKIDDEIIAEIRRSRFIVADFSHGGDGARGGVYYEAGFAHGLNIPVIFTCHKD